jgi:hypothetical protein
MSEHRAMTIRLRTRVLAASACAAALTACGPKDNREGDDTLAVPAAAVDTSVSIQGGATVKAGEPGAGTAQSGAEKAAGVDTPITRKRRAEDSARAARDTARDTTR